MTRPPHDKPTEVQPDLLAAHGIVTRASPALRWVGAGGRAEFRMKSAKAVLGSGAGVDVRVEDPKVSRVHAELEVRGNVLWLEDLGSTNGTFVSGVQVSGARLVEGAVVRVGDTEFTVHLSAPPVPVELWPNDHFGRLVGRSAAMRELFARLDRVARLDDPVLLEGETGTGKEEVARALHAASKRAEGPFIVVDCGALSESLLESTLFGHVRGAFTGADTDRLGSLEAANGGTVFLDEIGELPLELQPKLLRVLESQTVRRLGETEYRKIDVRFISATHQNLRAQVNAGTFREDLYFRIAVFPLAIPPLRARREDVALLVERFLPASHADAATPELLRSLEGRAWRGNVRELRNFVSRLTALGVDAAFAGAAPERGQDPGDLPFTDARDQAERNFERTYLSSLLARHGGDVNRAAAAAQLTASYFYKLMKRNGM